jgi:hypothetical protein
MRWAVVERVDRGNGNLALLTWKELEESTVIGETATILVEIREMTVIVSGKNAQGNLTGVKIHDGEKLVPFDLTQEISMSLRIGPVMTIPLSGGRMLLVEGYRERPKLLEEIRLD